MFSLLSGNKALRITKRHITGRLGNYGFAECNTVIHFLKCISDEYVNFSELIYILFKIRECLEKHDDGSCWFADLRQLAKQIEQEVSRNYRLEFKPY